MNRGARKAPIFRTAADCSLFLKWVGEAAARYGLEIHVFCLMLNHFHLLVRTVRGNVSKAMKHLLAGYVLELNRRHEWDGPVFKGRFTSQLIEDEDYLRYLVSYLHLNPVRANIVQHPADARWSSAATYMEGKPGPEWLVVDEVRSWFDSMEALVEYHRECALLRRPPPEGFCLERGLFRRIPTIPAPEPPDIRDVADDGPTVEETVRIVEDVLGVTRDELLARQPGRGRNQARRVITWVLAVEKRMGCREISAVVGGSPNAVSQVLIKMRRQLQIGEEPKRLNEALSAVRNWTLDGS